MGQNITSGTCALEYNVTMDVTPANGGNPTQETITLCYTEATVIDDDECQDNTAVIIIIILCVVMLLTVIGVGIYYVVHTTTMHEEPKFTSTLTTNPAAPTGI